MMMDNPIDTLKGYQRHFKKLIRLEQLEEMSFHLNEINSIPGFQREKKGRAILGLTARELGRGLGGIHLVRLNREHVLPDTEIGVGDIVILSSGHPSGEEAQAVVMEKGNSHLIVAYPDPPPAYIFRKKIRLDLFANDVTFKRMMEALFSLKEAEPLSTLLLNKKAPTKNAGFPELKFVQQQLNTHQKNAVTESLRSAEVFLIHGPPGTGKTTTLVEAIIQHARKGYKVLATADSNTAVDNIVEKLLALKTHVLRIGNPARLNAAIISVSIDQQIQDNPDYQQAAALREMTVDLKEEQKKYLQPTAQTRRGLSDSQILTLSRKGSTQRGISQSNIHRMAEWINAQRQINVLFEEARKLEKAALKQLIDSVDILCATNSSAGSEILQQFSFDVVFIDEATQSMEPSCLIPMVKGKKWVLAGDHKQLPPTVLSREASGLYLTLFERWISSCSSEQMSMLRVQYRMNQDIMRFPNEEFYGGKLIASPKVKHHHIGQLSGFRMPEHFTGNFRQLLDPSMPVCMVDIVNGRERQIPGSFSFYNEEEVNAIEQIVQHLMFCRMFPEDLGIISPYEQQVNLLKTKLKDYAIEIKTVDGFQGREKEIIIISLVRSNDTGNIGFLNDHRRLNVAITRARRKLIIAGHVSTMQQNEMYKKLYQAIGQTIRIS
jgi:predicted DNA helicase